jgi:hypothetical protein
MKFNLNLIYNNFSPRNNLIQFKFVLLKSNLFYLNLHQIYALNHSHAYSAIAIPK